jgi:1-acyl-sn-glycerol-3-phosphate acyltransferase
MPWFYYVAKFFVRVILLLFTRWQISGKENIPERGELLIVANHLSLADPPLLAVSIPRKVVFMAKKELFESRFFRYFISNFGAFPVHRGQLDRKAIRQSHKVLADGQALVMFPESTRSQQAELQPAYPGAALLACRRDVPILPIGITGTEKMRGIGWIFSRPRIAVNIGAPFRMPMSNSRVTKKELSQCTDSMMRHIAELLPAEYRGYYGREGEPVHGEN